MTGIGRKIRRVACSMAALLVASVGHGGCKPDFGERSSLVTKTRLVAVRASPPEGSPGAAILLSALVVSPTGTVAAPAISWAFCASPRPLTENDVVAADCVDGAVRPIGTGITEAATMPSDACTLFGPDAAPGARPPDADVTGGYYEPVRAELAAAPSIALLRVSCMLANASADVATDFAARYVANKNPTLGVAIPTSASAGSRVTFHASWSAGDAEPYVSFDAASQSVQPRREAMSVSWFVSDGVLDSDRSGRDESDLAVTVDDGFAVPNAPGIVRVWIVLRDSRGGTDFASADITVQ